MLVGGAEGGAGSIRKKAVALSSMVGRFGFGNTGLPVSSSTLAIRPREGGSAASSEKWFR